MRLSKVDESQWFATLRKITQKKVLRKTKECSLYAERNSIYYTCHGIQIIITFYKFHIIFWLFLILQHPTK